MTAANALVKLQLTDKILRVTGSINALDVAGLRNDGEALLAQVQGAVVVDLAGLDGANSALLSVLLCWQRFAAQRSLTLLFKNPGERLFALAVLANLDKTLAGFQASDGGAHPS